MEQANIVRSLSALAQETRLSVFRLLVQAGPDGLPAGRIAEHLGVALPTLSFHLKELVNSGLVASQSVSRFVIYRANYAHMNALIEFLTANCCCGVADAACAPKPERSTAA